MVRLYNFFFEKSKPNAIPDWNVMQSCNNMEKLGSWEQERIEKELQITLKLKKEKEAKILKEIEMVWERDKIK